MIPLKGPPEGALSVALPLRILDGSLFLVKPKVVQLGSEWRIWTSCINRTVVVDTVTQHLYSLNGGGRLLSRR